MAIDRAHIGYALPAFTVDVTAARVSAFLQAIGDAGASQDVAPPTFMKAVEGEDNSSRRILEALSVDLRRVLHAEQQFEYFAPIRVGDQLSVQRSVTDLYDKKNGALEFVVIESAVRDASGELVGKSRQVLLIRNPVPKVTA